MLKVLKLLLFYLLTLVTLFFVNLFVYKIPMHRKWVILKCVLYLLLDALFYFKRGEFVFMWAAAHAWWYVRTLCPPSDFQRWTAGHGRSTVVDSPLYP
jgi:hypothetical protein